MTFLPIVERELRVRARQKSTYRFRMGGAAVAIVIVVVFMLVVGTLAVSPDKFGAIIFNTLAWMAFAYCLLEGARNTADCLSEEKRAGTLGLLFLTDLKGYDVVLGKLMATSLNSFYGLLAIFPPLALPILLGGITAGEFWRLALVLMNTLFFSLTAGLLVSAASRSERKAWVATLSIILFFAVVPPALRWLPFLSASPVGMASPSTTFFSLYDAAYATNPGRYWQTLCGVHLLSWLFLISASLVLPRAWQDRPISSRRPSFRQVPFVRTDNALFQRERRRRLLDSNPVLWMAEFAAGRPLYLWIVIVAACFAALLAWLIDPGSLPIAAGLLIGALALHFVLAIWAAWQVCYLVSEARDSGTFELLLMTPLTDREIIQGHFLALQRFFTLPIFMLLCVEASLLGLHLYTVHGSGGSFVLSGILTVAAMVMLVLDLCAVGWFGMWMALRSRKPSQAFTKTVLYVLILPQLSALCCWLFWPIFAIVKDLIFINYAQDQLRRQFRRIVMERFASGADGGPWPSESGKSQPQLPSVIDR